MTKVFEKNKTKGEKKQPWRERKMESQVKELNKNLGRLMHYLRVRRWIKNTRII